MTDTPPPRHRPHHDRDGTGRCALALCGQPYAAPVHRPPYPDDPAPRRWTIEVCRFCDRLAVFPFCEHRDLWRYDEPPWCVPIVVRPAGRN